MFDRKIISAFTICVSLAFSMAVHAQAMHVLADGDVALGGNDNMHLYVNSTDGGGKYGELTFQRGLVDEWSFGNTNSFFYFFNYTAGHFHDELSIDTSSGDITVTHDLVINGQCTEVDGPCAPDYVFQPDYELLSIQDLSEFVTENKHLPNVPSAADIEANGINMRDFNFAMLEKIEELVLYTVSQQGTIDKLVQDTSTQVETIAMLTDRLAALEGQKVTSE